MAQYTKATNFAAKDALLPSDPDKIIKGAEFDDEFNAIQTAVNSKSNSISPSFTGTPLAPTATLGTQTTQVATTAFVNAALQNTTAYRTAIIQAIYPVGSLYVSTLATNPNTLLGFGTWVAFGAGKVLVSQDVADASFDVLEETGGSKDIATATHTHTVTATTGTDSLTTGTATVATGGVNTNVQPYVVVKMWKRTV
tara:strand:- start:4536 stop:5126 length:591 start_codon:yes stop_codon:yes gene_type:complete